MKRLFSLTLAICILILTTGCQKKYTAPAEIQSSNWYYLSEDKTELIIDIVGSPYKPCYKWFASVGNKEVCEITDEKETLDKKENDIPVTKTNYKVTVKGISEGFSNILVEYSNVSTGQEATEQNIVTVHVKKNGKLEVVHLNKAVQ